MGVAKWHHAVRAALRREQRTGFRTCPGCDRVAAIWQMGLDEIDTRVDWLLPCCNIRGAGRDPGIVGTADAAPDKHDHVSALTVQISKPRT